MNVLLTVSLAACSLFCTVICGIVFRPVLKRYAREQIRSDSSTLDQLHACKQQTPTMGGLFVSVAFTIMWLLKLYSDPIHTSSRSTLLILSTLWLYTLLGMIDDLLKSHSKTNGLTTRTKWRGQWGIAIMIGVMALMEMLPLSGANGNVLTLLSALLSVGWMSLVIVASANAVNLTDGLDGLASGTYAIVCLGLLFATGLMATPQRWGLLSAQIELADAQATFAILTGCTLGFLVFNRYPAKIFMGDAGALSLGGLLGVVTVISTTEFLMAIIGGVFVIETLSVIVQIRWNRWFGRKPLRCAPLHNHFVFAGQKEPAIVSRFWAVALVLSMLGIGLVLLRNQFA